MRRPTGIIQKLFIGIAIPLASFCAIFILLIVLRPSPNHVPEITIRTPPIVSQNIPSITVSAPVQLKIERIGVLALINPVGLAANGDMAIDENPEQLAWYKDGPKPGEEGSAVIAGHYGWKGSVPSVFNDLHTLVPGDEITATDDKGQTVIFVVTRLETYQPDQDATNVFRSDDGKAHLNLITCQGSWNNSQSTYSERLVVFTDLADYR